MTVTRELSRAVIRKMSISWLVYDIKAKHHEILGHRKLTRLAIENVRCQKKPFSELQGFSGRKIDHFPPYKFFTMYLRCSRKAEALFTDWLRECLITMEGFKAPKSQGGWARGSLMREITLAHQEQGVKLLRFEQAQTVLVDAAIAKRVAYYFALFDSVKNRGYDRSLYPPIRCYHGQSHYFIQNGHHRVAAMRVLGHEDVEVHILRKNSCWCQNESGK